VRQAVSRKVQRKAKKKMVEEKMKAVLPK